MKRFFAGLLTGLLIASVPTAYALGRIFSDVPEGSWYESAVQSMVDKGIIAGHEDGSFRPRSKVSRAELAVMFERLLNHIEGNQPRVIRGDNREELITQAVENTLPAVVSIAITKDVPQFDVIYINPFANDSTFQGINIQVPTYEQSGSSQQKIGGGTGFFVRSDGYILTNKHLTIDTDAYLSVILNDGTVKPAEVVYQDLQNDLALLKISGDEYPVVTLGSSTQLQLGQSVIAVGNALAEYENSVSVGIISGLNRSLEALNPAINQNVTLRGVIQTDAAINLGNSGGPLINLQGEVIGINVATAQGSNNIGFAIPSNEIRAVINRALK